MLSTKTNLEITEYHEKFFLGLSLRQLACFGVAAVLAIATCFVCLQWLQLDIQLVSYVVMAVVLPFLGLGFISHNGYPFEKLVKIYWAWYCGPAEVAVCPRQEKNYVFTKKARRLAHRTECVGVFARTGEIDKTRKKESRQRTAAARKAVKERRNDCSILVLRTRKTPRPDSRILEVQSYATMLWEALLMTASLRVKNDKYYVVLTHTTDGKKNQTWVSTGLSVTGNEGKARQIMLDMLGEKPEQAAPPDMLFSDAVRRWLEDVRHRVDEVTYQGYEVQARAHILPYFDDLQIRLCDVDGETLQTYINVKAKFGRSDGHGGLSAVSLRQHKNVLNQTLKLAQRDGLIQTNPADLVVMPHAAQFTGTFYTEAQMRDLLTAVKNERLYPIIYVTALYGLRRSEVLGLKWDSINFAMQTLTIRHTVARVTKVVEKNKTKNASSFRSFPLTDDAVRLFKILLQQEQIYRNHFGKDYIDNDYVFTWEDGHPYSPDYVSHTFHKLLKKYDLPHIRFHDLRHTCASMLLSEGYGLKDVQE